MLIKNIPEKKTSSDVVYSQILLRIRWRTLTLCMIIGLICAVMYIFFAPTQYEAKAQISMAQIAVINGEHRMSVANVEDPSRVVAWMSYPTSFTSDVLTFCGQANGILSAEGMSKVYSLKPIKGVPDGLELKVYRSTPESASECINSLFRLIKLTQDGLVENDLASIKLKLGEDQERLERAKAIFSQTNSQDSILAVKYLATRDEIRHLLEEISFLSSVITFNKNHSTRLITPIYVSKSSSYPKTVALLFYGLLGGLLVGILISIGVTFATKINLRDLV